LDKDNFSFTEILGDCGLYFIQSPAGMNHNGNRVGTTGFEFVLAIHLVSIYDANNNNIVYRTPIKIDTLSLNLKSLKDFLSVRYGIDPQRLYHVRKCRF
jgi:hypothetical protein